MVETMEQVKAVLQNRLNYLYDRLGEHPHNNTARCAVISSIDEVKFIADRLGLLVHYPKASKE